MKTEVTLEKLELKIAGIELTVGPITGKIEQTPEEALEYIKLLVDVLSRLEKQIS